ncbi:MAG: hypothetical protein F6K11_07655 [Leptolyngbya sp. SIO3F4]|nr:hypothetical protein [Leptolyngbya sp. SIO3F4]
MTVDRKFNLMRWIARYWGVFLISVMVLTSQVQAQQSVRDSVISCVVMDFAYTLQFPGGDLADRFGRNSAVGGGIYYKTKRNWIFGGSGSFIFGNDVKDLSMLDLFRDENGGIPGTTGLYANVVVFQRGFTAQGQVGKIFPWFGPNPNSGIMVLGGLGMMQHNIRYQDDVQEVPLLNGDSEKGYDRLTNGLMLSQFIGYRYLGNKRLLNFIFGFEAMQGFTQNRRGYNYDTGQPDTESRLDLLYGVKVGLSLPLYKRVPKEFYYE